MAHLYRYTALCLAAEGAVEDVAGGLIRGGLHGGEGDGHLVGGHTVRIGIVGIEGVMVRRVLPVEGLAGEGVALPRGLGDGRGDGDLCRGAVGPGEVEAYLVGGGEVGAVNGYLGVRRHGGGGAEAKVDGTGDVHDVGLVVLVGAGGGQQEGGGCQEQRFQGFQGIVHIIPVLKGYL